MDANDPTIAPSMLYAYAAHHGGRALRQRRAEPDLRLPGHGGPGQGQGRPHRRQGLQDRPDHGQDRARADVQGADARRGRLVLDQHPGQPRRRGAGRSGELQDQGRVASSACWSTSSSRSSTPSSTARCTTRCGSTTIRRAGDNKEGWDNIDIFGWLGYPMQIKVDFLCRDSILAAPLVLDLALFFDLAQRAGMSGIQEWLSFYFKSPQTAPGLYPGARPVHPADQAQEHPPLPDGRGADHPSGHRVLPGRLMKYFHRTHRSPDDVLARADDLLRRAARAGRGAARAGAGSAAPSARSAVTVAGRGRPLHAGDGGDQPGRRERGRQAGQALPHRRAHDGRPDAPADRRVLIPAPARPLFSGGVSR